MSDKKSELIAELDRILQVRGISWNLLPISDVQRLFEAFQKLKSEFEQFFQMVDEMQAFIDNLPVVAMVPQNELWRDYCV